MRTKLSSGNLKGRDHLGELDVDDGLTLKSMLQAQGMAVCTAFIWLSMWSSLFFVFQVDRSPYQLLITDFHFRPVSYRQTRSRCVPHSVPLPPNLPNGLSRPKLRNDDCDDDGSWVWLLSDISFSATCMVLCNDCFVSLSTYQRLPHSFINVIFPSRSQFCLRSYSS